MHDISIRPYQKEDREALRQICCDVADRGGPIESFFPDREIAADLLTQYYTDYEPQSSFVAVNQGRVVGYINCSLDNRRYGLVLLWILMPQLLAKAIKRGLFFKPQVQEMFKGALKNWRRLFSWRKKSFHSHQGHIHIGIAADSRGKGAAKQLVSALIEYSQGRGIDELTASVHGGNEKAVSFFESQGFVVRERNSMVIIRNGKEEHYYSFIYGKTIQTPNTLVSAAL